MTRQSDDREARSELTPVEQLFHAAAEATDSARETLLAAADPETVATVRALLRYDVAAPSLLDRGVGEIAAELLSPVNRDVPPQRFGPYRVIRHLGQGGMGTVYLAVRDDLGSEVALKILWDAPLSPARRERFLEEQRTLARLRHPCIVPIHDAGVLDDGTAWFSMEHVPGEHLDAWCRSQQVNMAARLKLFAAVCDAMKHAHQQLVVHGDIKPSNIIVDRSGRVRLLDFGGGGSLDLVRQRTIGGTLTPAYASPALQASGVPSVQGDIYALGVVLLQLLTDQLPAHERRDATGIRELLRTARVARRDDLDRHDLEVICMRALSLDDDFRYQSVEALLRDLERVRMHRPIGSSPGLVYRGSKYWRRHRRSVTLIVGTVLVAACAVVWALLRARDVDRAAREEFERTGRLQSFMLDLLTGASPETGFADSVRVTTLIEQGLREATTLTIDPKLQAETFLALGSALLNLGALHRADSALLLAARVARERGDSLRLGAALATRGLLKAQLAEKDSAQVLSASAVTMVPHDDSPRVTRAILEARARTHELLGSHDTALVALLDALRFYEDTLGVPFANQLNHLANNLFYLGQFDSVVAVGERVLRLPEASVPTAHSVRGDAYINMAAVARDRGDTARAVSLSRTGARLLERWYGPEHHRTAGGIAEYGRALLAARAWNDAERELRRALTIREQVFGRDHPLVANLWSDLANVAIGRQRPAEAEPIFRRIIEIYRRKHSDRHYLIGLFRGNLAGTLLRLERPREAEEELRAGLAMYAMTLPPDHQNVGIHLVRLARALAAQGRHREALVEADRGLAILARQSVPSRAWVTGAHETKLASYVALGDSAGARRAQGELESAR